MGNIIMSKEVSEDFNILFTSSGRRGYLLEYFRKALNGRGMIHASNSSSLVPSFKHADKTVVTPLIYDKDYIPFLLKYCKENNIKLIISLFDIDLPILAKNKDKFLEIGTKVLVSNEEFINICNDKWKSFNYLKENGFNVPKTYIDYSEAEKDLLNGNLKFPVIIKPRWGMGSISIEEAFNMEELKVLYEKAKRKVFSSYLKYESLINQEESIIIQEKLDGDEYGLDIINDLDGNYQNTIVKKKYSMVSGETYCAKTVSNDKAVAIGEKLSRLSSHIGNLDVDIFLVGDKFYILEMNARFGGGYPFSHIAGVNLPLAIINWYNGIEVDKSLLEAKVGVIAHKDISILDISEYNKN